MKKHEHRNLLSGRISLFAGLTVILVGISFCEGCAIMGPERPKPVTVTEIIEMSKAGVPADQIVTKMKTSGTIYRLTASQLSQIKKDGAPDAVIDYMQQTYIDAIKRDAAYENWEHWTMYGSYWYGGVPFGWPHDTVYIIREQRSPQPQSMKSVNSKNSEGREHGHR